MRINGLLMAAGSSSRFGGCKQLALFNGTPLVRRTLEILNAALGKKSFVVLGANQHNIRPVVEDIAHVINYQHWQMGMGSSIAHGIKKIETHSASDGVLVALADQPHITDMDFTNLTKRFDGNNITAAYYANHPGVPAIFPSSLYEDLKQLYGDRGAKSLLTEIQTDLITVAMPNAEFDIDVKDDLKDSYGQH